MSILACSVPSWQALVYMVGVDRDLIDVMLFRVEEIEWTTLVTGDMCACVYPCRDDPRMPTVRGVVRRGMTVEGLKEFVISQVGGSLYQIRGYNSLLCSCIVR